MTYKYMHIYAYVYTYTFAYLDMINRLLDRAAVSASLNALRKLLSHEKQTCNSLIMRSRRTISLVPPAKCSGLANTSYPSGTWLIKSDITDCNDSLD
jgi:hypothetical protein